MGQIWLEFNQELNYNLFKVLTCTNKKGSSSSFGEKNKININPLKTFYLPSYAMISLLVKLLSGRELNNLKQNIVIQFAVLSIEARPNLPLKDICASNKHLLVKHRHKLHTSIWLLKVRISWFCLFTLNKCQTTNNIQSI